MSESLEKARRRFSEPEPDRPSEVAPKGVVVLPGQVWKSRAGVDVIVVKVGNGDVFWTSDGPIKPKEVSPLRCSESIEAFIESKTLVKATVRVGQVWRDNGGSLTKVLEVTEVNGDVKVTREIIACPGTPEYVGCIRASLAAYYPNSRTLVEDVSEYGQPIYLKAMPVVGQLWRPDGGVLIVVTNVTSEDVHWEVYEDAVSIGRKGVTSLASFSKYNTHVEISETGTFIDAKSPRVIPGQTWKDRYGTLVLVADLRDNSRGEPHVVVEIVSCPRAPEVVGHRTSYPCSDFPGDRELITDPRHPVLKCVLNEYDRYDKEARENILRAFDCSAVLKDIL